MTKDEMENKSRAFIAEISEILELGKPIDILKLCATTDLFFKPLEERIAELEKENIGLKTKIIALENANRAMLKELDNMVSGGIGVLKTVVRNKEKLIEAREILRKFLDAKSIEETCVAESEADKFLSEVGND